jgi:large subunit ribosomal protein L39e
MSRNKDLAHKLRRGKALRQNRSIPTWVVMKTRRKIRTTPYSERNWRNQKLKKG